MDSLHTLSLGPYELVSGVVLPDVEVAYVTHGELAADGRNAVLVTHGYTSGTSMLSTSHLTAEGSWVPLLGPGRPLDTDRHFIVCSNMLGSSFGTTGPASINPATGQPWGPTFPRITMADIVGVQHRLLSALGVTHLRAVVGPSYGGWQALQWALDHPDKVDAIGVLMSGLTNPPSMNAANTRARLAADPAWQDGWHYQGSGMYQTLFDMRLQTLRNYGLERLYEEKYPDPVARLEALKRPCRNWAERFDPNSLVVLADAAEQFDVRQQMARIQARMLFVVCTTDALFPPNPVVTARVGEVSGEHRYREIDSPYGHMASGIEWRRLEDDLRWLLA